MKKNKISLTDKYFYNISTKQYLDYYKSIVNSRQFARAGREYMESITDDGIPYFVDKINHYDINSNGYRDEEFEFNKADILCVGCSHTFGTGVPQEGTWPKILESLSNKKTANLGTPGESIEVCCKNAIKYCRQYGNPEYIFCLFPDFFRILFFEDLNFHYSPQHLNRKNNGHDLSLFNAGLQNLGLVDMENNRDIEIFKPKKYIKTPFNIRQYISPHQAILQSLNAIFYLESFCNSNNIKLIWTTWDLNTQIILDNLLYIKDFELEKYIKWKEISEISDNPNFFIKSCSIDHDTDLSQSKCWESGSDIHIGNEAWTHPGIHYQYHAASFFKQFIDRE